MERAVLMEFMISRTGRLFEEGDVGGGDAALVFGEAIAEVAGEEVVFGADADFGADHKEQECGKKEPPGRDEEAGGEQGAEQRRINWMPDEAVGAGGDEFVIGAEASVKAPLTAEGESAGPGEKRGECEEQDRERQLPKMWRSFPEAGLPQKRVSNENEEDTPTGSFIDLLGGLGFALEELEEKEGGQPEKPACGEDDVSVRGHLKGITRGESEGFAWKGHRRKKRQKPSIQRRRVASTVQVRAGRISFCKRSGAENCGRRRRVRIEEISLEVTRCAKGFCFFR